MIIKGKMAVNKIEKARLFAGKKDTYLDFTMFVDENKEPDQYGNSGFISQDVTKEEREKNVRGPIIGNFKIINQGERRQSGGTSAKRTNPNDGPKEDSGIPF